MTEPAELLVLSATEFETAPLRARLEGVTVLPGWPPTVAGALEGVPLLLSAGGIGKANAAAAVAIRRDVLGVLQVGIGGAYPGSRLELGSAVIAHSEFDLDLGVGRRPDWTGLEAIGLPAFAVSAAGHDRDRFDLDRPELDRLEPNRLALDRQLAAALAAACGLPTAAFATSDAVTGEPVAASAISARHGVAVESMEGVAAAQTAAAIGLPFAELRGLSNVVGERDKLHWRLQAAVTAACEAAAVAVRVMWGHVTKVSRESR